MQTLTAWEYFLKVWHNYANFNGRARRSEYWYFTLFNFLIAIGIGIVEGVLFHSTHGLAGFIGFLYALASFIPTIAVTIRRFHDTGRSGWWYFILFVPLIGIIIWLIFLCEDSQVGNNQYGANPKAIYS